ncbi:hypothetical protein BMF94_2220 [Rhodotorula taiwanensis]|uniref:DUF6534 domain-containing protein n=1 Tax=Rhodotorula taiwanensis TaxID=741276 RepID=A0A2S5BD98_9BASI|nr:hypothetical protein BMF94_2220 [Rhodotorula taiwanensis]
MATPALPSASPGALPTFDSTIGPFQGITLYNDRIIVALVMVIDVLHSAFSMNTIYFWCVTHYADPQIIAYSPWSFTAEPILTGFMAAVALPATGADLGREQIVHIFYGHRVLTLAAEGDRSSRPLFFGITLLTLVQLSFSIAVGVKIIEFDREFARFASWIWGACVWLGAAALADLIVCVSYLYYLNRTSRAMAGPFERSSKAVIKVATVILATNGLSAITAIASHHTLVDRSPPQLATVLFGVFRDANWHAILQLTLAKFLALSLLIALNARTLLADLLGVDPGIFQSSAKRALPAAAGQTTTTRSKFSSVLLRSGPYGQAAEAAGFDGRPPKSPGPSAVFSPSAMVRDADGRAFPVKASGLGARGRDGNISDLDDLEDDLDDEKDEFGASSRGSYPVQSVAFEDHIEQSSAHSRTPFVRSESDMATPPHPYALAS